MASNLRISRPTHGESGALCTLRKQLKHPEGPIIVVPLWKYEVPKTAPEVHVQPQFHNGATGTKTSVSTFIH